ncbi:G2/mitotic-specific cyclin-B-like [Gigantopelta aegis]|uniref:G2/mitotic-specific cyclin-B-like n=1 Tax=Gigantopelta aegis TaxID=1735272 RepID=UPI001B88CF5B|nr:G2/mitotic-specific cyclin-B-like [Gigantopelta aegis]
MAFARSLSSISDEPQKFAIAVENNDATIISKTIMTRNGHRAALGDIGNKVSKMTIDPGKQVVKKEMVQPFTRLQKSKIKLSARTVDREETAVVVELVPSVDVIQVADPMDISVDKSDAFSKALLTVENIDSEDKDNPHLVTDYVNDIYHYMRKLEVKYEVKPNYLDTSEITGKMRSILIDWLCQVHHRFNLLLETLYLTVATIDRYLQICPVTRSKLQLVGVTSMLVASKYEEMYAPEVADFVYITDNAYTKTDIKDMERDILRKLDFSLGKPVCLQFLRRNSKAGKVDTRKHTLAKYLMELTITEYDMVQYLPSEIAAAALCLSIRLMDDSKWTTTLAHYSAYTEKDLQPLVQKLAQIVQKAESSKLTAVRTKFSSSKFMKISQIPQLKRPLLQQIANGGVPSS